MKQIYFEPQRTTIECEMRFYNVLEAGERASCLKEMEQAISEDNKAVRKVVCIMGGDGSLATTIKFLRGSIIVNTYLAKGRLSFAMLPFGTGNDGAQVFGWGNAPASESWLFDLESLMRDLILAQTDHLSLWVCTVDGQMFDAKGNQVDD